jgi:aquaporin Z
VAIALAHGVTIAIMVSMMAHLSGGVFNPAIQVALLVTGKMPAARSGVYIVAQLLGALAAAYALKLFWPSFFFDAVNGGAVAVNPDISTGTAVLIEALMTAFLVWAVFATAVDDRGPFRMLGGLTIGLTIAMAIFATASLTGAALNPARWFGPAVATGTWTNWWVWIVGPICGGVIAGVAYLFLFLRGKEPATP